MTDTPATTGRRTWRLIRILVLPWIVCLVSMCVLIALSPSPFVPPQPAKPLPSGFEIDWTTTKFSEHHPAFLSVMWNRRAWSDEQMELPREQAPIRGNIDDGLVWHTGRNRTGFFASAFVSVYWLIPFPLLWSGFNLWRWVRRAR